MKSWGECYYDHFERFLGHTVDGESFSQNDLTLPIQVASYENIFDGCKAFCSLGLTNYSPILKETAEVFLPIDDEWQAIPYILANALFYMIQKPMTLGWGISIRGIKNLNPEFVERCGKTTLYFTDPRGVPETFARFECEGLTGKVYLAIFITEAEVNYFKEYGAVRFEELLETKSVDVYNLKRASVI